MGKQDISINKLTPAIGAEVIGINLNDISDGELYDRIYDALIEHQVVFS